KAFAGSLQEKRSSVLDPEKLNNVLSLFGNLNLEPTENFGKDGELGFSGLEIQDKTETGNGEVSLEQWVGPSNAIEGYGPKLVMGSWMMAKVYLAVSWTSRVQ
ncbi:RNA polymerase II subunit B1 CTD phosphatase RPAP2, partial [Trifolium medium]|nr:RNA polymerase II subunit B1 CTD phosphatase RPAP2 [Trifolium medium]